MNSGYKATRYLLRPQNSNCQKKMCKPLQTDMICYQLKWSPYFNCSTLLNWHIDKSTPDKGLKASYVKINDWECNPSSFLALGLRKIFQSCCEICTILPVTGLNGPLNLRFQSIVVGNDQFWILSMVNNGKTHSLARKWRTIDFSHANKMAFLACYLYKWSPLPTFAKQDAQK